MSGGSLDYAFEKVNGIAEAVEASADRCDQRAALRVRFADELRSVSRVLRAIEWADSGDAAPDSWVQAVEDYLG